MVPARYRQDSRLGSFLFLLEISLWNGTIERNKYITHVKYMNLDHMKY